MNLTGYILSVEGTWARRALALAYVLPGILYNILWHFPKTTLVEAWRFVRYAWARRPEAGS